MRGKIIGLNGHRIKSLKKQTTTSIDNVSWFNKNRKSHGLKITGTKNNVAKAVNKIKNILNKQT